MGADAYGHTGYTGTSLWIDPDHDMFVILLTNRVHAAKARRPAKVISDVRADLADAAALAVTDNAGGMIAMPRKFRADKAVGWNRPERAARGRAKGRKAKSTAHSRSSKHGASSSAKKSTKRKSASVSTSRHKTHAASGAARRKAAHHG